MLARTSSRFLSCIFLGLVGCAASDVAAVDSAESELSLRALPRGVTALAGLDPTANNDDLVAFDRVVAKARYVGLGESVHTSGGFHRARGRLLRHLVEEGGARGIALETPWASAQVATAYVARCQGTAAAAVHSIFPVFASVEMQSLFTWLCDYNRAHASDPVSFFGVDIQDPWADGALLRQFGARVAVAGTGTPLAQLDRCLGVTSLDETAYYKDPLNLAYESGTQDLPDADRAACATAVHACRVWIDENRGALVSKTSVVEVGWASLALDAIGAHQEKVYFLNRDFTKSWEARDSAMARALVGATALLVPHGRVAVIAHNGHIAQAGSKIEGGEGRSMGEFLVSEHHASYAAVALTAYDTRINWKAIPPPRLRNGPRDIEQPLHVLGQPAMFVDLTKTALTNGRTEYQIGGRLMVPLEQYRGMVYLDISEGMMRAP